MVLTLTTYSSVSAIIFNKISNSPPLALAQVDITLKHINMFWAAKRFNHKKTPLMRGFFFGSLQRGSRLGLITLQNTVTIAMKGTITECMFTNS